MVLRGLLLCGLGALTAGAALAQPRASTPSAASPAQSPGLPPAFALPRTLDGTLAATYSTQPALLAERAKLRATDENVPQALAGWRPTVVMAGTAGYGDGLSRQYLSQLQGWQKLKTDRDIATAQATVSQPLYTGGKVAANVNRSKNQVMAERANLIAQEQSSFLSTVTAFVGAQGPVGGISGQLGVIEAQQLLALAVNNEQVLAKQLQATNDRFRVGEITRTDVAQAEAALAGATAQRENAAGNLQIARAFFQQVVGYLPPGDLIAPQPLKLPVPNEQDAAHLAAENNPAVVAALFNDAAAKDAVDVAFAQLLPQLSIQGQAFQSQNASARSSDLNGYQVVAQLSVPLYQGGAEYSAVRQAKQTQQQTAQQLADARRTAVQNAVQAWETLATARATVDSLRSQITANQIALEGTEREAIVGSRTTLDVLNAQQALLTSQVNLIQALSQLVTASYALMATVGRLTAHDLHLNVPLYDDTAYYRAVKDKWVGLGDYATDQPAR